MKNLRKISKEYYLRQIMACFLICYMSLGIPVQIARATPDGGVFTVGTGGFNVVGDDTQVTVNQVESVIEWGSPGLGGIDTSSVESLSFFQGGLSNSAVLNRIKSGSVTQFDGALNGLDMRIFIINPAGVIFGGGATVNVTQLVASSLNMTDPDFLDAVTDPTVPMKFLSPGVGPVENYGTITAGDSVYLVGGNVLNAGTIISPGGLVVMAAGVEVWLGQPGSSIIVQKLITTVPGNHVVNNTGDFGTVGVNPPVGELVLAAGDIFSNAISNVDDLAAVANRDITLNDAVTTNGDITLTAVDDVDARALDAGGTIEISAADDTINLHDDVTAGTDILLNNDTVADGGITLDAGQDVVLADTKTMTGSGALTVQADRDVVLGGDVEAAGDLILKADADTIDLEPGGTVGGIMLAKSNLETTAGDIDIHGYNIVLDGGLVDAASNLTLHNDTRAADNLTLKAGNNVDSKAHLTALGNLTIEAGDLTTTPGGLISGTIAAHNIDMDADGSTLTLKQNNKLDLEQNVETWDNRINTHLVAESTADSVTSEAAAKWKDITATAHENIVLSDESGDITTLALTTTAGDIKVTAEDGKVFANGSISAGRDVVITATDESSPAIELNADVDAGQDILLNNNTLAADGVQIDAVRDVRVGWNEAHQEYDPKTLTGDGDLLVEAGRHITLGGDVTANGMLRLYADIDWDTTGWEYVGLEGDMTAYGSLETTGGFWLDVIGKNIQVDGTVDAFSSLGMYAADNITLEDSVQSVDLMNLWADWDVGAAHTYHDGVGTMWAKSTLTSLTGSIDIRASNSTIKLGDNVTAYHDILLRNNTWAADDVVIDAGHDVIVGDGTADGTTLTGEGALTVEADHDIILGGAVIASDDDDGDLILKADAGISDDDGDMIAYGTITNLGGSIDIYSSDSTTELWDDVTASVDILLHNNTWAEDGVVLAAGDDIHVGGDDILSGEDGPIDDDDPVITSYLAKTLTGEGDLTLLSGLNGNGYGNILLGGEVTTVGELAMIAGVDGGWDESNVKVNGPVTTDGLWVQAGDDIEFYSEVVSSEDIMLSAYDDVQTFNGSSINMTKSWSSLFINAGDNGSIIGAGERNVEITGNVDSAGGIAIHSDDNVDIDGYVKSGTGYINITADDGDGDLIGSIDIDGYVDSGAQLYLYAGDDITLDSWVRSAGDMLIKANWNADGQGDVKVYGTIESTGGDIDIYSADDTTFLYGDYVDAGGSVYLHNDTEAAGDIIAGQDVTIDGTLTLFGDDGGVWGHSNQYITATNGKLTANNWVHKTSIGNLNMFGGFNGPLGTSPFDYSVKTKEVRVDDLTTDGQLTITGNAFVWLDGDIYSRGSMFLTSNNNDDISGGYMQHTLGTIHSLNGDVDLTAKGSWIHLYGGNPFDPMNPAATMYVTAGRDILLRDNTYFVGDRGFYAGDDVVLESGKFLDHFTASIYPAGALTIEASDTIALGVDPEDSDSKWKYGSYGSAGDVTVNGDLILTAGDDIYAHGKLLTESGSGGNITANADDDIRLFNEPTSADADGTLTLIADSDSAGGGDLRVDGDLFGNMELSGVDVTVDGDVTSFGVLTVDADDDIRLKSDVSSWGEMTMIAGDDITLNQDSGDTTSDSDMTINAGGDVTAYNNLTTTGLNVLQPGDMSVTAENIYVGENADSAGSMTMTAIGDDEILLVLPSDAMNGSIKIEGHAKSEDDMEMTATGGNKSLVFVDLATDVMNGSISIGEYAKSTRGNMTMSADGGDVLETVTLIGPGTVLMNGSICIGDYAESKYDMLMTATGGSEGFDIILPDALDFDGMNGSIKIGTNAESTEGGITMTADGGCEFLTNDYVDVDLMDGSIKIGGNIISLLDMELSAHGGSELLTEDTLDVDGLNGSILIGGNAEAREGGITMTAIGGSEILTIDEFDIDGMNGSILVDGSVTSRDDIELLAVGGSEFLTADEVDIDGMNGSIWITGSAESTESAVTMTAMGGSEILTVDLIDIDGMNGSIKIGGHIESKYDLELTAKGGSEIGTLDLLDIDVMNGSIYIGDHVESTDGAVTMTAEGGKEILSADLVDFDLMNGSIKIGGHIESKYDLELTAKGGHEFLTADLLDIDLMNGSIYIGDHVESTDGAVTLTAEGTSEILTLDGLDLDLMNGSIFVVGSIESQDDTIISAQGGQKIWSGDYYDFSLLSGDVVVLGDIESYGGDVEIYSSDDTTYLGGDVTGFVDVLLNNNTRFIGIGDQSDQRVEATTGTLTAKKDLKKITDGDLELAAGGGDTIYLGGDVETHDGDLIFENAVIANRSDGSGNQTFDADGSGKKLWAWDTITKTTEGNLTLRGGYAAGYEIDLDGDVTVEDGDLILGHWISFADDDVIVAPDCTLQASDDVKVYDDLHGEGDLTVDAGDDIKLHGDVTADGDLDLYASDSTIYLWGDAYAGGDLSLHANTEFEGWDDQYVDAGGTLTADGWLDKDFWGSLYLHAYDDISLADHVLVENGGISIIAETGKIFTPGGLDDTLNITIAGYSDQEEDIGVELPYDPEQKAAIVIISKNQDLKLGSGAELVADGIYNADLFDDRPGVDFLDHDIPADGKLGGDPIDVAIYLASYWDDGRTGGDVTVGSPISYIADGGAMVVDALDSVFFGPDFVSSLIDGKVGWLEASSRISATLETAIGRLPYAENLFTYLGTGKYVLRGENPEAGSGAWVLGSVGTYTHRSYEAAADEQVGFGPGGCPALMAWLADEIGVEAEDIQVYIANTFALSTDIQPCELCARLKDAATVLADTEGIGIAALGQVINEFVTTPTPPSEEQMAVIATAFADHAGDGTYYAAAGQWIDALAQYVGMMTELGYPAGDAVALAGKYVAPVMETGDVSLTAYVEARLAVLGG